MCENCKRAAYELELQWGAGHVDYGKLKSILTSSEREGEGRPAMQDTAGRR